jgi:hypothetical protein
MDKELEKKMNELAEEFDKASWFGRRSLDYFEVGFTEGVQAERERSKILLEALNILSKEEFIITDRQFEIGFRPEKIIREALAKYKEQK